MMNKRPKWDAFLFLAKLLNKTPWLGSVSKSVSGEVPSDSSDMQI